MTELVTVAALLLVALIHVPPITGLFGPAALTRLYGFAPSDPSVSLLLRHRGALFAVVATLLVAAAFWPALRPLSIALGTLSVLPFLMIATSTQELTAPLERVVIADWIALAALALAGFLTLCQ